MTVYIDAERRDSRLLTRNHAPKVSNFMFPLQH